LKKQPRQKILFLREYAPFIEVLEHAGFETTVIHEIPGDMEKVIWSERPKLIILFMDGLDYNGMDPAGCVPAIYLSMTLSVSSAISTSDLLKEVEYRLGMTVLGARL
jgi:hypothetical protein